MLFAFFEGPSSVKSMLGEIQFNVPWSNRQTVELEVFDEMSLVSAISK